MCSVCLLYVTFICNLHCFLVRHRTQGDPGYLYRRPGRNTLGDCVPTHARKVSLRARVDFTHGQRALTLNLRVGVARTGGDFSAASRRRRPGYPEWRFHRGALTGDRFSAIFDFLAIFAKSAKMAKMALFDTGKLERSTGAQNGGSRAPKYPPPWVLWARKTARAPWTHGPSCQKVAIFEEMAKNGKKCHFRQNGRKSITCQTGCPEPPFWAPGTRLGAQSAPRSGGYMDPGSKNGQKRQKNAKNAKSALFSARDSIGNPMRARWSTSRCAKRENGQAEA